MSLTKQVRVNSNYTRSINLERDAAGGTNIWPYIPTNRALQTLGRIVDTINLKETPRAWSLIGQYGSGKSAFGLFLSQLLGDPNSAGSKHARQILRKADSNLARKTSKALPGKKGCCSINLTGSSEALSKHLIKAMLTGAQEFLGKRRGPVPSVIKRLQHASEANSIPTSEIIDLISDLQKTVHNAKGVGVLIIVDELGKFLEFEARHRNANDIYLLQAIAEAAFKPNNLVPLHLVVLLHQAFEQYFQGMGEQLKNEWKKIQGRFENIPFLESTEQTLRILAATLTVKFDKNVTTRKENVCEHIMASLAKNNALPAGMKADAVIELINNCYPLHPLTLLLLPTLCQKVAQNERTLFTYMGGQEPHGFLDTLSRLEISNKELPWVMPWDIYEYFILNQPGLTTDHVTHRRWAEVVTALERLGDAPIQEINLLKTIGLLNIVGVHGGLKASKEIVMLCGSGNGRTFNSALKSLQEKSILTYRKYSGEYRVWQGSDFDLETSIQEQKEQITNIQLAEILNERKVLQPLVARRYAIETGTLRYFKPVFIDRHTLSQIILVKEPTLYICLIDTREDEENFQQRLGNLNHSLALGVIVDSGSRIRETLLEAVALQRVQRSSPMLASDPVALRELKDRLSAAIRNERIAISSILEATNRSAWYWGSTMRKVHNKRVLQELLTKVLKENYTKTPHLYNELINRERPSASAVAARKKLLLAMLKMEANKDLGIEKFPPEKAIYRSILQATGLHDKTSQGWQFVKPQEDKSVVGSIHLLWQKIEDILNDSEHAPITVAKFYEELSMPPYGIKAGLLPVLFLAACLAYKDEIAIYEAGYYSPFLTQEVLEKIIRSPELFSIQRFRVDQLREQLFKKYAQAITLDNPVSVNMIAVAKPLARFMVNLPDYTQRTKRVSEKAQKVREHFFMAKSPTRLLFQDLPFACGFEPISPNTNTATLEDFSKELKLVFAELRVAYHKLLGDFRSMLTLAFNENEKISLPKLREQLRGRYGPLQTYTIDTHGLKAFLGRLADPFGDDGHWLNSLATFIARKPPEKWLDEDINMADYRLVEFSKRLRDLERLRLHYADKATSSNEPIEVVMLRTVRQGGNEHYVTVALDDAKKKAVDDRVDSIPPNTR